MRLPRAADAVVKEEKLTDYLLSATHPSGRSKARFFLQRGFRREDWEVFARELLRIAASEEVLETVSSPFGTKYVIDGYVQSPTGERSLVRTVWIIEAQDEVPHFVTAYPA